MRRCGRARGDSNARKREHLRDPATPKGGPWLNEAKIGVAAAAKRRRYWNSAEIVNRVTREPPGAFIEGETFEERLT